ncbi:MAG: hypothetical protein M0P71_09805 [Melioribacteraceae bacterium]|nr:hypothetical protein [Melioribacteraceae bacterium]
MKTYLLSSSALFLLFFLQSCSIEPILYHSEANLPFIHRTTKTVFKNIMDENSKYSLQLGVISAVDNDTLSYVLLARSKNSLYVNDLTDCDLSNPIPFTIEQVKEFIIILNSSADRWDSKFDVNDGIGYEFMVRSKIPIIQLTKNGDLYYSSFKYYFQNNKKGPLGTILFDEILFHYQYKLKKSAELRHLSKLLSIAINE